MIRDKRFINFAVILILSGFTTGTIAVLLELNNKFWMPLAIIIMVRSLTSRFFLSDYKLSWSRASTKTGFIKNISGLISYTIYLPILVMLHIGNHRFLFLEMIFFLFLQNIIIYSYSYILNKKIYPKKQAIVYGAGNKGLTLERELRNSEYRLINFIDDNPAMQKRSIDGIPIVSQESLLIDLSDIKRASHKVDLLIIAIPLDDKNKIQDVYEKFNPYFKEIKIFSGNHLISSNPNSLPLRAISIEDLLCRKPQDLDQKAIAALIKDKVILITGAGGSIGSEITRQAAKYNAKQLILVDHSEFNLYSICDELNSHNLVPILLSVTNYQKLDEVFTKYKPQIVIHAAAYKHVPLVESNPQIAIHNNIVGSKNCIDLSIKHQVQKFVLISTDKAVRPTSVMGATKRVCELYAQNAQNNQTEIVCVRFGNVLNSSGSVIPKFKAQISAGGPITVTHPEMTRYFMLIPEACSLVLQAAVIGTNGDILILNMGEPVKILDLAHKMAKMLSDKPIPVVFSGLRAGEKLYEELLINESDKKTVYPSITIAKPTFYEIKKLNKDIDKLLKNSDYIEELKQVVPEFNHSVI